MTILQSELTNGVLYGCCEKVRNALLNIIKPDVHAKTYEVATENIWYAEPEFTGKYIDVCVQNYRRYGNKEYLENAKTVVESIIENQRKDGYLGCLAGGIEFVNFGVWNQAFTIFGLISYYRVTADKRALEAAIKSARFTMEHFVSDGYDIMDAINYGTQHISILFALCDLFEITKDEKIKEYILFTVNAIKNSKSNFFSFEDILKIESVKGIENFVILLGILRYADLFGDESAVSAVKKYWQQVNDTQIRNTGNGTLNERWSPGGNGCMLLGADVKPNETCVAVGWCELSLALFYLDRDPKYIDAVDKTLYNHMLAAISDDGADFAYYQPNFGAKCRFTSDVQYKCCRYRGITLFSYMNDMLYFEDGDSLIPMIYTSNIYESSDSSVKMQTDYPFDPEVRLSVSVKKPKILKLRIPADCRLASLTVNATTENAEIKDGYACLELLSDVSYDIVLSLENVITQENGIIDGIPYKAYRFGCVLLAAKDVYGKEFFADGNADIIAENPERDEKLKFTLSGVIDGESGKLSLCEYANADNFAVWMPIK